MKFFVKYRFLYLLDQFNCWLKVQAKINKYPRNTFALILFLLQNEHVMIEELLQTFVCEIYTELFKTIRLYPAICYDIYVILTVFHRPMFSYISNGVENVSFIHTLNRKTIKITVIKIVSSSSFLYDGLCMIIS